MEKEFLLEDIDEETAELLMYDERRIDISDSGYIIVPKWYVSIPELGLLVNEGVFVQLYDDGEWVPDWSCAVIYNTDGEYLYLEQGTMYCALHNFANYKGIENISGRKGVLIDYEES